METRRRGGYSSEPTASSSMDKGRRRTQFSEDDEDQGIDEALHPSFSSLRASGMQGKSHLHLQSTPLKALHRVSRRNNNNDRSDDDSQGRERARVATAAGTGGSRVVSSSLPVTVVASSVSEVSTADDEHGEEQRYPGRARDEQDEGGSEADNENENADGARSSGARNLRQQWNVLLVQDQHQRQRQHLLVQPRPGHTPSIGSSTLVDQDSQTGVSGAAREKERAYAGDGSFNVGPSVLPTARPSSAPASREMHGPPADGATTGAHERISPLQDHISRFVPDDRPTHSSPYARGRFASADAVYEVSQARQESEIASRVHDIFKRHVHNAALASSSRSGNSSANRSGMAREASSTSRRPVTSRQRLRDLLGDSVSTHSKREKSQRSVYVDGQMSIDAPARPTRLQRGSSETPTLYNNAQKRRRSTRSSMTPRPARYIAQYSEEEEDAVADAGPDPDLDSGSHRLGQPLAREAEYAQSTEDEMQQPAHIESSQQDETHQSEGSFSPSLPDLNNLGSDSAVSHDDRSDDPGTYSSAVYGLSGNTRDRTSLLSKSRSKSAASPVPVANGSSSLLRKTPPKTPRPPGAYFSTTPYSETGMGVRTAERSALASNRSRLLGNSTIAAPLPGAYAPTPLPIKRPPNRQHRPETRASLPTEEPVKVQPLTPVKEASQSGRTTGLSRRSPGAIRTDGVAGPTYLTASSRNGSVANLQPTGEDDDGQWQDENPSALTDKSPAKGDTSLQGMLGDIVKPIQALIGSIQSPVRTSKLQHKQEGDEEIDRDPFRSSRGKLDISRDIKVDKQNKLEHDHTMARLAEADRIDRTLSARIEEMRKAVDEMGRQMSTQVSSAISETFAHESRRRRAWLLLLIFLELILLWIIVSVANARASLIYQTSYFDPFSPSLYPLDNRLQSTAASLEYPSWHLHSSSSSSPSFSDLSTSAYSDWRFWWSICRLWCEHIVQALVSISLGGATDFSHGTFLLKAGQAAGSPPTSRHHLDFRIPT